MLLALLGFVLPLEFARQCALPPPGLPLRLGDAEAQYRAARELHRRASGARGAERLLAMESTLRAYRAVEHYWPAARDFAAAAAFRRGEAERSLDRPGRARAAFECVLSAGVDADWAARARLELAALHLRRGEDAQALDRLGEVVATPGVSPHWQNRARGERAALLLALGRARQALAAATAWRACASSSVEEVRAEDQRLRALCALGREVEAALALAALERRLAPLAGAEHEEALKLRRSLAAMEARALLRRGPAPTPPP